jgi:hypothetical protein
MVDTDPAHRHALCRLHSTRPAPRKPGRPCPTAACPSTQNVPMGRAQRPSRTFPVGEPDHSPGLLRQQLPRVTNQKLPPEPCRGYFRNVTRHSPPEFAPARSDSHGHTPRPAVREPGRWHRQGPPPAWENGGSAVLQVGPGRATDSPQRISSLLSLVSFLGRRPPGNSSIAPGCRSSGYPGFPATKTPEACRASLDRRTLHALCLPHPVVAPRTSEINLSHVAERALTPVA